MISTAVKETDGIESEAQAVALANEIERAEAAVKGMKQELKTYVNQHGPVETFDKVWEINVSTSWSFGSDSMRAIAQNIALEGMNPWDLLTLPKSNLEKLGWGEDVLSQYGTKKETNRFSSHKKIS